MKIPLLVIGGGLSGLAAAIRAARFIPDVLLVEKHSRLGGLNSYYYRDNILFETGLHAITNYAGPENKKAPLNRLLRQLKLSRDELSFCQQIQSEIIFSNCESLTFTNNFEVLRSDIESKFPRAANHFGELLRFLDTFDPFSPAPFRSTRAFLAEKIPDPLLIDMLLCPLMFYGSSHEQDMDLSQFAIMFRALFLEGLFRPSGTIKDFLHLLDSHYRALGGVRRLNCGVKAILLQEDRAIGVELETGETIFCDHILSTVGYDETLRLIKGCTVSETSETIQPRMGFVEAIFHLQPPAAPVNPRKSTIIFFNEGGKFNYIRPEDFVNFSSGVICFPGNFQELQARKTIEMRSTHLANAARWKQIAASSVAYDRQKKITTQRSLLSLENIIGSLSANIVYVDIFTPVTIERYTGKIDGAIYGSPKKIKDGDIGFANLFLAGTDQGFLGIIGSMLSGVSIVNQHILPKL